MSIKVRVLEKDVRTHLEKIKVNMFVRQELDYKHVESLKTLIEAEVPMANMQCVREASGDIILFDGRHRKEAYYKAGYVHNIRIDIVSVGDGSEKDFIAAAYAANAGGSKPPTPADTEHTIELLVERDQSVQQIADALNLPSGLIRNYVTEIKSRLNHAKLQRAANAVVNGKFNVPDAATEFKVNQGALKKLLQGKTRKKKEGLDGMMSAITKGYKSALMRNHKYIKSLTQAFEDGDVEEKHVLRIFNHIEQKHKDGLRNLDEWRQRFAVKTKEASKIKTASA